MKKIINTTIKFALAGLIALSVAGCTKDDPGNKGPLPEADFSASETSVVEGTVIQYTDLSSNEPYLYTWNFPGGSPTYSAEKNPSVTYLVPGTYSVTMKARNDAGADEVTKEDYIEVTGAPIAFLSRYNFTGDLSDDGLNNITALSNYGDPTYTSDKNGAANSAYVSPAATGSYLTIPDFKAIGGNNKRTVMAWFKLPPDATSRNTIVSWGVNSGGQMFNIMIENGQVRVEAGSCSLKSTTNTLKDNNWHHVAVSYDPADGPKLANAKIYIDGTLDVNLPDGSGLSYNSAVIDINTENTTNDVMIGYAVYSSTGYFFKGIIDDLRIIDDVLIPDQIAAIAAAK